MGTLVQFRDLPGGPVKIKFADDITRHCLCKSCNMLSLTMYADPASHFFCETCINVQSNMHKKYDIYCPEERKNVSFDEVSSRTRVRFAATVAAFKWRRNKISPMWRDQILKRNYSVVTQRLRQHFGNVKSSEV
ncbi:hypothetical protein HPB52_015169 [Rhipicephalus sanguineus]|uniref:Uncharacterized protein n=1 Tax=Rhipicephalus sanguineus TaxID=34632 RepID=A0A9D4SQW5_RHISA|nr:hypothetical protein HPB52_015169 [Rhipicephalus sanguineus]